MFYINCNGAFVRFNVLCFCACLSSKYELHVEMYFIINNLQDNFVIFVKLMLLVLDNY
jgi:hypothetical protein